MKLPLCAAMLTVLGSVALADGLPVITANPTNRLVAPGASVTLLVAATGAESFQWRQNGMDLPGATNGTLTITNAQPTNSGYYLAIAKNATAWVPSQMAYLNVTPGGGVVPFSNATNTGFYAPVRYMYGAGPFDTLATTGIAQLMAGPEADQLQPVPDASWNLSPSSPGIFNGEDSIVPNVSPGQTVFYQVRVTYPPMPGSVQYSSTMKLVAGGNAQPTPSIGGLAFPAWPEWPSPMFDSSFTPTTQLLVAGESASLKIRFADLQPSVQWRKDGQAIVGATNVTNFEFWGYRTVQLVITNAQPADAGVYDLMVRSGYFDSWAVSSRIKLSVQSESGAGIFQSPRLSGDQFVSDFVGAAGRNYRVECSTNLVSWTDLITLTNTTGSLVFSNNMSADGNLFYRSRLLP